MDILEIWKTEPEKAKKAYLGELTNRLSMLRHPCKDVINGSDCPCEGNVCVFKAVWDIRKKISDTPLETLQAERIAELTAEAEAVL